MRSTALGELGRVGAGDAGRRRGTPGAGAAPRRLRPHGPRCGGDPSRRPRARRRRGRARGDQRADGHDGGAPGRPRHRRRDRHARDRGRSHERGAADRSDHHRDRPQRVPRRGGRDERHADPLRLHADHLRDEGLLGGAARRRAPGPRPVRRPADLPREPRGLHAADGGDLRTRGVEARRRLGDERLVPDRHAPERHDRVRPDLPRRRADRVRRVPRPLARRRREGRRRSDGLDRDLPGGHPRPAAAGRRGRRRARRRRRPARPQQPLLLPGDRRPRRADRVREHRAGAAAGDRRAARAGRRARRARADLRPDRALRARGDRRRSPTAATPPRAASTTTGSRASRAGSGSGSTCAATR